MDRLKVFLGWDAREPVAYHVAAHSIITRASKPVEIIPLVQSQLRNAGVYTRPKDEKAATEFSLTRFLVPFLCEFRGYAVFMDSDVLVQADIHDIMWAFFECGERADRPLPSVAACQHDYIPKSAIKMDGQVQTVYPKKNWSSVMVFDNARCTALTPDYVNRVPPSELHQFYWAGPSPSFSVGALPLDWNHLVGEYEPNPDAKVLHYTLGGPWFGPSDDVSTDDAFDRWRAERDAAFGVGVSV